MTHSQAQSAPISTRINRVFVDWSRPLLSAAATWIVQSAESHAPVVDLQRYCCIVPGRRAGRLLLGALLRCCQAQNKALLPPTVCTPGQAAEHLLAHVEPIDERARADAWSTQLAWLHALHDCDHDTLRPLFAVPPEPDDWLAWQHMAQLISGLHETLAGGRLGFTDVIERAERLEMLQQGDRWNVMAVLHERYRAILKEHQLIDRHDSREHALQRAVANNPPSNRRIAMIGVVELNALMRGVLQSNETDQIAAIVHAPEVLEERFDAFGCVRTGCWSDAIVDDERVSLLVADGPADQAQQVLRTLASFSGTYAADEIILGMGDASLAGPLSRAAAWAGLSLHDAAGRALTTTAPCRLLQCITDWIGDQSLDNFAVLIRHPDMQRWLQKQLAVSNNGAIADWLTQFDSYRAEHIQQRISGTWLGKALSHRTIADVFDAVQALLAPLAGAPQPCHKWCAGLRIVFDAIYDPALESDPHSNTVVQRIRILQAFENTLTAVESAAAALQPVTTAETALRLIHSQLQDVHVAQELHDDQIEMLGWLELHTDPSPVLILTGFNDGFIPSAVSADIFLPNALRSALELPDNDSRYARDAYYTQAAQNSRSNVTIITGRRASGDEPLTPSRLLLSGDDELLTNRARLLFDEDSTTNISWPAGLPRTIDESGFTIPDLPDVMPPPSSMSVTAFRSYLACPYRFALGSLLGLQHSDDQANELDAMQFGNVLHETLRRFGQDNSLKQLADEEQICKTMLGVLDDVARDKFGVNPPISVRVQLSMISQRLRAMAALQTQLRSEGWEILETEIAFKDNVSLDISGQEPMPLRGVIDRIDRNTSTGSIRIIDYKTGESARTPHNSHHGRETLVDLEALEWFDLQLPLYDYIARAAGVVHTEDVELGYITLPRDSRGVAFRKAQWSREHLDHAVHRARAIVQSIRAGKFERNPDHAFPMDDFARLCHTEFFASFATAEFDAEAEQ